MSRKDLEQKIDEIDEYTVLLEETGFDATMEKYQQSILKMDEERQTTRRCDDTAENGCLLKLNDTLQAANDAIEANYQAVIDALSNTYDCLSAYKTAMKAIDSGLSNAITFRNRPTNMTM